MREVLAGQLAEPQGYEKVSPGIVESDLAALSRQARELDLDGIVVPAAPNP